MNLTYPTYSNKVTHNSTLVIRLTGIKLTLVHIKTDKRARACTKLRRPCAITWISYNNYTITPWFFNYMVNRLPYLRSDVMPHVRSETIYLSLVEGASNLIFFIRF